MKLRSTPAVLLAFALASFAQAQTAGPAAEPSASDPPKADAKGASPLADSGAAVTIQGTGPADSVVSRAKDTLSVDFPDEEIRTILRNVADLFELNLVVPESLQGKTSVKLRDVTWHQIFQVVLTPIGYTSVVDGNIIKIVSQDSLQQEPASTEVFILNYARAADVLPTLNSLVDGAKGGKIVVDARSNALVITERPSVMNRIRTIIQQLDKATDQVMIESKFVEVINGDVKDIGVNWTSLSGYGASAGPFGRTYNKNDTSGNNSTNTANNTDVAFLQQQQALAGQVVGSAGPLTPAASNQAAIDAGTAITPIYTGFGGTSLSTVTNAISLSRIDTAVFSADQFKVILSALQTRNDTKVVSNPTIVTLNNTEATINVGDEYPIPNYSYNEQQGSFVISGFTYKPIGIILKVTPQVNASGFIKLILAPEVSQSNGSVPFSGTPIPVIGTRKATTQVSLKDGYTMGIGGLLKTNVIKGTTQVPLLGSIPLVGNLFKSKHNDITTTNLIIFITAKTMPADGAPIEQVFDPRRIREMDIKREDLPGYREKSDPFGPALGDARKKKPAAPSGPNQNPMRPFSRS